VQFLHCSKCGAIQMGAFLAKDAEECLHQIKLLETENAALRAELKRVSHVSSLFEKNSQHCSEEFEEKLRLQKEVIKLNARLGLLEFLYPKETNAASSS